MRLSDWIRKIFRQFLLIFALIMILLTILRQLYDPDMDFDLSSVYIIMAFSLVAALIELIKYTSQEVSENNMRVRLVIHFLALEAVLIGLASVAGIVETLSDGVTLAIQIAIIYGIIRLLSWRRDKKVADEINEKLKLFQQDLED